VPLTFTVPATAEVSLDRHGWWYKARQQPVSGLLPVPVLAPTVPEGGLYVANDPTGPLGVSAARFHAPGAGGGTLTLTIAPGSNPSAELILACPTQSEWGAAQGGDWEARPAADCDAAGVEGRLSEDGTQISWELHEAHKKGDAFDVVLTPAPDTPTPFQISFEQPTAQALVPTPASDTEPGGGGGDPGGGLGPDPGFGDDFGFGEAGGFDPGQAFLDDSFTFDTPLVFDIPGAPPITPEPTEEAAEGDEVVAVRPPGPDEHALPDNPVPQTTTERIVALLVIGLIAAGLWRLSGMEAPAPRLIGGLASAQGGSVTPRHARRVEPVVGGVGRFARPRTGLPRRF
jgi:hypothetical protein